MSVNAVGGTKELLRFPAQDARLSSGRFMDLLAFMGPGMILASVTIGNGEIFSASRGGAIFGYALVWTFLFGAIMKALVVYAGARYIVLTGEHPFARFGHIMPGPKSGPLKHWFALILGVLAIVCFPAWIVAYILGMGQWTQWTFGAPGDPLWWGIAWGVLAWLTLFVSDFSVVEKFQTIVVLLMVFFSFVAVFVANPDWVGVLLGLLPTVPQEYPAWVVENFPKVAARPIPLEVIAYLGALGGGTYDYIGYLGTFREKGWGMLGRPDITEVRAQLQELDMTAKEQVPLALDDENLKVARTSLKAPRIDTTTSFISVFIFAVTFMVLGAVILGGLKTLPADNNILQEQANFFTQLSPFMKYFYQLAIWAAFFGSMQALSTMVYPHTFREAFAPAFPKLNLPENWQKVRAGVATYSVGVAIILAITNISYTTAISFAGILGGVFSLGIWGLMQIYTEKVMLPKELRMGTVFKVLLAISSVILLLMGLLALLQFFGVKIG